MARLRTRLITDSLLMNLAIALVLGAIVYFAFFTFFLSDYQNDKIAFANALAVSIRGEDHRQLTSPQVQTFPIYKNLLSSLSEIRRRERDIIYIYTVNKTPEGLRYAVDGSIFDKDIVWVEHQSFAFFFSLDTQAVLTVTQNADPHSSPFSFRDENQVEHHVDWTRNRDGYDVSFDKTPLLHITPSAPLRVTLPDRRELTPAESLQTVWDGGTLEVSLSKAGESPSPPGSVYVDSSENLALLQDVFRTGKSHLVYRGKNDLYGVKMTAYAPIIDTEKRVDGVLTIDFSDDEIEEIQRGFFILVFGIMVLSFLITVGWSFILSGFLVKPILQLQKAVKRVEEGDLMPELPLERKDEFGQLAAGFQKMLKSLRETLAEREKIQQMLLHQAFHDDLTGLPNKKSFLEALDTAIQQARRSDSEKYCALVLLNIDLFKSVNDTLGRAAADLILKMAYQRVRGQIRQTDQFFRLDGDEFALILNVLNKEEDAAIVAQKIILSLQSPFRVEDQIVHISASIGIAIFQVDGTSSSFLLRSADTALAEAKKQRGCYRFFTSEMQKRAEDRLRLINNLHRAVKNREFRPYFQIQVDQTGKVIAAEALARWITPNGEVISPLQFIPLAEETNLIVPLGKSIIEQTCRVLQLIRNSGNPDFSLAVNLSSKQFQNEDLLPYLHQVLAEHGLSPKDLHLEITEGTLAEENQIIKQLDYLHRQGFTILVDDFGTGYSSLARLKKLPLDILKVDKMFVDGLPHDKTDKDLVASIISLSHIMGLKVIAEGVETEEQVKCLKELGCDAYQGYHFSKPVAEDQLLGLIGLEFKV